MVIREEDDERTLVDLRIEAPGPPSDTTAFFVDPIRLAQPEPPFEGSGQAVSTLGESACVDVSTEEAGPRWQGVCVRLAKRRQKIIEIALGLAFALSLAGVAYQQLRVVDALREAIDELGTSRSTPRVEGLARSPSGGLAPAGIEERLAAPTREVAADERDALEHRGATLIASNDFSGALAHYQMLAGLYPDEPAFRDVLRVLKAKLRCASSVEPESSLCP
jgi:hypothetical protein